MNRVRLILYLGFFGSLLAWLLPARFKPYHISRELEDYKILLVEKDAEFGLGPAGVVKVYTTLAFGLPPGGKRDLLAPIRRQYIEKIARSKQRWPVNSYKLHYDEWGPSRTVQDSGVEQTLQGNVFSVPYSMGMIFCGILLLWDCLNRRLARRDAVA